MGFGGVGSASILGAKVLEGGWWVELVVGVVSTFGYPGGFGLMVQCRLKNLSFTCGRVKRSQMYSR